jgi:4-hydroxy-tetrahydrodipicolinate synthase
LPTPFDDEGCIDAVAFERLCDLQVAHGATALVVGGTTGEAPTLSSKEHDDLVRITVARSRGRIPVIAGAGANATAHAIALAKSAEATGADAILSVVPYYNKPTQEGLYCHFRAIAAATSLPVILYDVPSRTACGLADETIARLAELPRVIGLKDAAGDTARPARLRSLLGTEFRLLCGDDALALPYLAQGGDGCISVTSNVAPGLCRNMFLAWKQGQSVRAQRLARSAALLTTALFRESNPVPVTYALAMLGLMSPAIRLPLVELSLHYRTEMGEVLLRLRRIFGIYDWQRARTQRSNRRDRRLAVRQANTSDCVPPWARKLARIRFASEALREAGIDLYRWRYAVEAEIGADVELHVRDDDPRERHIEAHLGGLDRGVIVIVRP